MYEYEPYKVTKAGGGSYPLCWKFIPPGNSDKVLARLPASLPTPFYFKNLKFVTTNQTEISYDSTATASGITLTLPGGDDGTDYSLHAVYNTPKGWKQVGRVDVMTRSLKTFNVVIVPVEADISVDKTNIETNLNNIYSKYGIRWTVDVNTKFAAENKTGIENIVGTNYQLFAGDAFLSVYSLQQKELNSLFKQYASGVTKYDNKTVYLFALKNSPKNTDGTPISTRGDMPIGYQWGYLFGGIDAGTVAHELGHGKLSLKHTFNNSVCGESEKGKTKNNLMDYYSTCDTLVCKQWQYMHNKALIKDYFQSDEDAAYIPGIYVASHDKNVEDFEKTNSFYTYYAPSGLPFSLPKRAIELNHSGKLSEYPSKDFIVLPDKCLTSFKLDGQVYVAIATKQEFLGYLPFLSLDESKALKDEHSIPNLEVLNLYDLDAKTQEAIKYLSLEGFTGDYFAKGPLPNKDGLCPRCLSPIDECYCGRACVCYAHGPNKYGNYGDKCNTNRQLQKVGIPFFDPSGKISSIKLFKAIEDPSKKSYLLHDQMLEYQGRKLFLIKIGEVPLDVSFENEISGVGYILDVMELSVTDPIKQNIIDNLQEKYRIFDLYKTFANIDEAIEDESFAEAFYEALKIIPAMDAIFDGIEMGLSFVYSEQVMNALYISSEAQLSVLYKLPITEYHQKLITEMEKMKKISSDQLNRIKEDKLDYLHTRVCTCP
jgi:hypothetical protein